MNALAKDFHASHETDLDAFRPHMVRVGRAYGGQSIASREDWETPDEVFGSLNADDDE